MVDHQFFGIETCPQLGQNPIKILFFWIFMDHLKRHCTNRTPSIVTSTFSKVQVLWQPGKVLVSVVVLRQHGAYVGHPDPKKR